MKKVTFQIKKWTARALIAIGAMLGLSSCFHGKNGPSPYEAVYGPPPDVPPIEVIEDVYGPPPVDDPDTVPDTVLVEPESPVEQDAIGNKASGQ